MVQTRDFDQSEVHHFAGSTYVQVKLAELSDHWKRAGAALPVAVVVSIIDDILATQPAVFTGDLLPDLRLNDVLLDSFGQVHLISQKSLSHEALISLIYRLLCGGIGEEAIPSSARMFLAQLDDRAHWGMHLDAEMVRAELRQALGSPAERFEVGDCVRSVQVIQSSQRPRSSLSPWSNVVAPASELPAAAMPSETFAVGADVDLESIAVHTSMDQLDAGSESELESTSDSQFDFPVLQESPTEDLPSFKLDAFEPEPEVVIDSQFGNSDSPELSEALDETPALAASKTDEAFEDEISAASLEAEVDSDEADAVDVSENALEAAEADSEDHEDFGSDDDFVPELYEGADTMIEMANDPGLPPPPPPASLMPKDKLDAAVENEFQARHSEDEELLEVPELVDEPNDSTGICVTNYPEPDYYVEQNSDEGPPSLLPRVRDGVHTRPGYREVTREKSQSDAQSQLPRVRIVPTKRRPLTLPAAPPARLRTTSTGPADSMISLPRKDSPTLWVALICVSIVLGAAIYSILGS